MLDVPTSVLVMVLAMANYVSAMRNGEDVLVKFVWVVLRVVKSTECASVTCVVVMLDMLAWAAKIWLVPRTVLDMVCVMFSLVCAVVMMVSLDWVAKLCMMCPYVNTNVKLVVKLLRRIEAVNQLVNLSLKLDWRV